jgi:hypothetical protein
MNPLTVESRGITDKQIVAHDLNIITDTALEHLRAGWSVIPCGKDKKPLGTWKKYQTDPMDCQEAQTRFKTAPALAVICGAVSNLTILDFEQHSLELPEVKTLFELAKGVPRARSGGGGIHLFFAHSSERNKPLELNGQHIGDVRGEGGYIVLPPSAHPSGNTYEWIVKPDSNLEQIPVAIQQILEAMGKTKDLGKIAPSKPTLTTKPSSDGASRKYVLSAFEQECLAVRNAPEGMGNHQINSSAFALGQLIGAGVLSESEVRAGLENAVNSWAKPDPSAQTTIQSGLNAGKLEPRDLNIMWETIGKSTKQTPFSQVNLTTNFSHTGRRFCANQTIDVSAIPASITPEEQKKFN